MRSFNYLKDYNLIDNSVKAYIKSLIKELTLLVEYEKDLEYVNALEVLNKFEQKYSDLSKVQKQILDDLCSPYCVEYCFTNGTYPEHASELGEEFNEELNKIILLEENLRLLAVRKYEKDITNFVDIVNGEDFLVVGHASILKPGLQEDNNLQRVQYLSTSIFSNKEFNTFQGEKIVYLVNVNSDNLVSSSYVDSVTYETNEPSFLALKNINENRYIKVGYTYDVNECVTSIMTPRLVEMLSVKREVEENNEMYEYKKSQTNEIVLDRNNTFIKGILLIGNGCDLLMGEYIKLKENNQEFKCINKGLYRLKNNQSEYNEEEYKEFIERLDGLELLIVQGVITKDILENYYNEVVLNMNYSEEILNIINERFSRYIEINNNIKNNKI